MLRKAETKSRKLHIPETFARFLAEIHPTAAFTQEGRRTKVNMGGFTIHALRPASIFSPLQQAEQSKALNDLKGRPYTVGVVILPKNYSHMDVVMSLYKQGDNLSELQAYALWPDWQQVAPNGQYYMNILLYKKIE